MHDWLLKQAMFRNDRAVGLWVWGFLFWVALSVFGCADLEVDPSTIRLSPLAGRELIYQFPNGRTYSATYHESAVTFVLLEPSLAEPPSATLRYSWVGLSDHRTLVVWDSTEFGATFVIDLDRKELHASSVREDGRSFRSRAQITEVRAARER